MIEGIKRIRKAFKRITERIKKTETAFDTKTDQALRLSENLEKMKEVRKKMMVTGEEMSKTLEEKSKQIKQYERSSVWRWETTNSGTRNNNTERRNERWMARVWDTRGNASESCRG